MILAHFDLRLQPRDAVYLVGGLHDQLFAVRKHHRPRAAFVHPPDDLREQHRLSKPRRQNGKRGSMLFPFAENALGGCLLIVPQLHCANLRW